MKLILRSYRPASRLTVIHHSQLLPFAPLKSSPISCQSFNLSINNPSLILRYTFATSKQQQQSQQSSASNSNAKEFKIAQLKDIFQNKMNKYNVKTLLKIYQTLTLNKVPLSSTALKQFDYRLILELNSIDHPTANSFLEMSYRNGQSYQAKGNNKLLRGINLKFQKNKITLVPQQVQRTLKLLNQMKFPKLTISRVFFSLVKETDVNKRVLNFINNLNALRVTLMGVEMLELDLQIKKRLLENLLKIKPKGVLELAYFYSIIRTAVTRLDEAVFYEAQKKTVYDLAFNPYGMYAQNDATVEQQKSAETKKVTQPKNPSEVNPTIMQRLISQKEQIIQQTLNKIDIREVSEQLYFKLLQTLKGESEVELQWRQMKQVCLLLIGNWFRLEDKERRKMVSEMVGRILHEGLVIDQHGMISGKQHGDKKVQQSSIDSSKLIRLPEFIILIQQLSESSPEPVKTLKPYFSAYHCAYYGLMNLEQKLMFTYHKYKLLNQPIQLSEIKEEICQVSYGLNPEEFGWLNKVLSVGQNNHSVQDKQTIKQIWDIVERGLDQELEVFKKEKIQQQLREAKEHSQRIQKQNQMKQKTDTDNQGQSKNGGNPK